MFALACIGFLCRKRAYYFEKGIRVIGIDMRQRKSRCRIRLENGKLKNGNRTPEGDGGRLREKSATHSIFFHIIMTVLVMNFSIRDYVLTNKGNQRN